MGDNDDERKFALVNVNISGSIADMMIKLGWPAKYFRELGDAKAIEAAQKTDEAVLRRKLNQARLLSEAREAIEAIPLEQRHALSLRSIKAIEDAALEEK